MSGGRIAAVGEIAHGDHEPDVGWFIVGEGGYFDVDNGLWFEDQEGDAPWDSENFRLLGTIPGLVAQLDAITAERDEARHAAEQCCIAHAAFTVRDGDCPICDLELMEARAEKAEAQVAALSEQIDRVKALRDVSRLVGESTTPERARIYQEFVDDIDAALGVTE